MSSIMDNWRAKPAALWARSTAGRDISGLLPKRWTDAGSAFLAHRTPRERVILAIAGVVLIGALYWLAIWQPLANARAAALNRISVIDRVVSRVRSLDPATIAVPKNAAVTPATAITNSAGEFGLAIRRLDPNGAQISVVLEDEKFDGIVAWLDRLDQDYGLRVLTLELDRRPEPGVVSAKLDLGSR